MIFLVFQKKKNYNSLKYTNKESYRSTDLEERFLNFFNENSLFCFCYKLAFYLIFN